MNSAVFTWTNLLVVVAELDGAESEALDLVPLITNTVLEEHQLIVGIVVVADPGTVPINSRSVFSFYSLVRNKCLALINDSMPKYASITKRLDLYKRCDGPLSNCS